MAKRKSPFEKAMQELEEIVRRLEEEQLDLEESMALYEKGMELSRTCEKMLETAQARVNILACGEDEGEEIPFAPEEDEANGLQNNL
ncbi:MAG: exodeoxyribonuclease VII small subunit [Christensenellales bacterium]